MQMRLILPTSAFALVLAACGGTTTSTATGPAAAEPSAADDAEVQPAGDEGGATGSDAMSEDEVPSSSIAADDVATEEILQDEPPVAVTREEAAEAAAANQASLVVAGNPKDTDVLVVADGTVTSLVDAAIGDRPLLVWFWAPHCPVCRREGPAVEQFARDNADVIQVIGMGSQDDFLLAQDFIESTGTITPTMLWEPSLTTWRDFGVSINSQMMVASADLSQRTTLFYGFGPTQQQAIIDALPDMFA